MSKSKSNMKIYIFATIEQYEEESLKPDIQDNIREILMMNINLFLMINKHIFNGYNHVGIIIYHVTSLPCTNILGNYCEPLR